MELCKSNVRKNAVFAVFQFLVVFAELTFTFEPLKIFYFYLSKAIDKAFLNEYNNYNKSYQYDTIF